MQKKYFFYVFTSWKKLDRIKSLPPIKFKDKKAPHHKKGCFLPQGPEDWWTSSRFSSRGRADAQALPGTNVRLLVFSLLSNRSCMKKKVSYVREAAKKFFLVATKEIGNLPSSISTMVNISILILKFSIWKEKSNFD